MKKITGWCLALIIGLAVIGQAVTAYLYQQQREQLVAAYIQDPQISIRLETQSGFWWQLQERWILNIDLSGRNMDGELPDHIELAFEQDVSVRPWYLAASWQFDPSYGIYAEIFEEQQLDPLVYQASWHSWLPSQTVKHEFVSESYALKNQDIQLQIKPLNISSSNDFKLSYIDANGSWEGLSIHGLAPNGQENGDNLVLEQIQFSETLRQFGGALMVEKADWSIEQLSLQGRSILQLNLQQLQFNSLASKEQEKLKFAMQLQLAEGQFSEQGKSDIKINELVFKNTFSGLELASLEALSQLQNSVEMPSDEKVFELFSQLLAQGAKWKLEQLSMQIDATQPLPLSGDVLLSGNMDLQASEQELSHPLQLLPLLDVEMNLDMAEQLLNNSPLFGQAEMLRQQGMLLNQEQRDQAHLIYNNSEFSVNGQPLPF